MSSLRSVLFGLSAVMLLATQGLSQYERRGSGGRGRGGFDPAEMFNRLSNGKDVLIRSELDPGRQRVFDILAERVGATNGQITRDQFNNVAGQRTRGGPEATAPAAPAAPAPPSRDGGRPRGLTDPSDWEAQAEASFQRRDRNGDGVLTPDEMPEDLRAQLATWDTDGNGLIDINEYKAFYHARQQQRAAEYGQAGYVVSYSSANQDSRPPRVLPAPTPAGKQPAERKPLVYHSTNLPKELPPWFAQLDTNHDAQIGLYEWKASGRSIEEFQRMDRNGDGFLTVEEVLFYLAQNAPPDAGKAASPAAVGTTPTVVVSRSADGDRSSADRGVRTYRPPSPGAQDSGTGGPGGSNRMGRPGRGPRSGDATGRPPFEGRRGP